MSRRTTPGSIGRETFSHSERDGSSDLAGCTNPNKGVANDTEIAAVSATNRLRQSRDCWIEEEEEQALVMKRNGCGGDWRDRECEGELVEKRVVKEGLKRSTGFEFEPQQCVSCRVAIFTQPPMVSLFLFGYCLCLISPSLIRKGVIFYSTSRVFEILER